MKLKLYGLCVIFFLGYSCESQPAFDEAAERQKILILHHAQRDYHFNDKAEEFAGQMNADFISINHGIVSRPTLAENTERFGAYFKSVSFSKWDDVAEPIIRFSDDGSLAYTIVQKEVVLTYPSEQGDTIESKTEFAWLAIYRKNNGEWKIESVASTNKPDEREIIEK